MNRKIMRYILFVILAVMSGCIEQPKEDIVLVTTSTSSTKQVEAQPLMIHNFSEFDFSTTEYRVGYSNYYVKVSEKYRDEVYRGDSPALYFFYEQNSFNGITVVNLKHENYNIVQFEITNAAMRQNYIPIVTLYFEEISRLAEIQELSKIVYIGEQFFVFIPQKFSEDDYESENALDYCKDEVCEELVIASQPYFKQLSEYLRGETMTHNVFDFIESFEIR